MSSLSDLPLLSAEQVADLLGVPTSTVYHLSREGRIPSVVIGRRVRFSRRVIEEKVAELVESGGRL